MINMETSNLCLLITYCGQYWRRDWVVMVMVTVKYTDYNWRDIGPRHVDIPFIPST